MKYEQRGYPGAQEADERALEIIPDIAGGLARIGGAEEAVEWYKRFLTLLDYGAQQGIYSREDALARLKKLVPGKNAMPGAMERTMKELERVMK